MVGGLVRRVCWEGEGEGGRVWVTVGGEGGKVLMRCGCGDRKEISV